MADRSVRGSIVVQLLIRAGLLGVRPQRAKGKTVQVRFLDGKGVKGELIGHDLYCLSVKLEAAPEPMLIFKHAIAYLARA